MPGKTPAEAIHAYLEPLQQALSCFGKHVLRASKGAAPGVVQAATFNEPVVELLTRSEELLYLSFIQQFAVEQMDKQTWKVRTVSYLYGIENADGNDILSFHWHPESDQSPIFYPHLHIGFGAGLELRTEIQAIHFRTCRMAFEDLGIMLIQEFGVVPERDDALDVLNTNLATFTKHRTWS